MSIIKKSASGGGGSSITTPGTTTSRAIVTRGNTAGSSLLNNALASVDSSGNLSARTLISSTAGTQSLPAVALTANSLADSGLYVSVLDASTNARAVSLSVHGTQVMLWDLNTGAGNPLINAFYRLNTPDGSSSQPAYSFSNDGNTGMYRGGSGQLTFGVSSGQRANLTANQYTLGVGMVVKHRAVTTTPITVGLADTILSIDSSSIAITCNLPSLASVGASSTQSPLFTFRDVGNGGLGNAATNNITITPSGTEKINGVNASITITTNGGTARLYASNAGWFTI